MYEAAGSGKKKKIGINKWHFTHIYTVHTLSVGRSTATGCVAASRDSLRGADRWALSVDKEASESIGGHYRDAPTGTQEKGWGVKIHLGPLLRSSSLH